MAELVPVRSAPRPWNPELVRELVSRISSTLDDDTTGQAQIRELLEQVAELGNAADDSLAEACLTQLESQPANNLVRLAQQKLLACMSLRNERLDQVLDHAGQGRSLALDLHMEGEAASFCALMGIVYFRRADYFNARRQFEEAIVASRRTGLIADEARGLGNLALILKNTGRLKEAEHTHLEARSLFAGLGNHVLVAQCDLNLSSVRFRRGRWLDALDAADRALPVLSSHGLAVMANHAAIAGARAERALGRVESARQTLAAALAEAERLGKPRNSIVALEFLGDCDLDEGLYESAASRFREGLLRARSLQERSDLVLECSRGLALAELGLGDLDSATAYAEEAIELARLQGDGFELAGSLVARGRIHAGASRTDAAIGDFRQALELAAEVGDQATEAIASLLLARQLQTIGDVTAARGHAALAERRFHDIGAEAWEERARNWLTSANAPNFGAEQDEPGPIVQGEEVAGSPAATVSGFLTVDPRLRRSLAAVRSLAPQDLNILILGESGTGKELVAQAVHQDSGRKGPFVPVNCSAFPGDLIEGELFGHAKGAYTGADRERVGLFEYAHRGTLFLDEIGDMPVKAQARLLRALENGEVRRLGENTSRTVDVRIVAATHRHLMEMVGEGQFRLDLYYRLAGYVVELPPVRERGPDAKLLIDHFVARFNRLQKKSVTLSPELRHELSLHSWPGNVREIRMVVQRLVSLATSGSIVRTLPFALEGAPRPRSLPELLETEEKKRILEALRAHNWNKARAANTLGTNRTTLIGKMKRMGIELKPS